MSNKFFSFIGSNVYHVVKTANNIVTTSECGSKGMSNVDHFETPPKGYKLCKVCKLTMERRSPEGLIKRIFEEYKKMIKCYNCGEEKKSDDGSCVESGVWVCYSCQNEDDQISMQDIQEQSDRLGLEE